MQRLHDEPLESSSEAGSSDSEKHLPHYCEGCYVLKGTGEQCALHGYGGAPLQSKCLRGGATIIGNTGGEGGATTSKKPGGSLF